MPIETAVRNSDNLQPMKFIAGAALAMALFGGAVKVAIAEEVDLSAVTASISQALEQAAAESRVDNEYVNFMRSNEELDEIIAMCEMAGSEVDGFEVSASVCGDKEPARQVDPTAAFTPETILTKQAEPVGTRAPGLRVELENANWRHSTGS